MKPNPFLIPNQHTSPEVADHVPDRLRDAKRLRDETGYPIAMCVEALIEAAGDFAAATELLPGKQRKQIGDSRMARLLEGRTAPDRYDEFAHPIWEGAGWLVTTGVRMVAVRAEAEIKPSATLFDALCTATCWTVLDSGSSNVTCVTVRVEAPHQRTAWTVLESSRSVIPSERWLFHAQELHSPRLVPCEDADWRSAETGFRVEVMPWVR